VLGIGGGGYFSDFVFDCEGCGLLSYALVLVFGCSVRDLLLSIGMGRGGYGPA